MTLIDIRIATQSTLKLSSSKETSLGSIPLFILISNLQSCECFEAKTFSFKKVQLPLPSLGLLLSPYALMLILHAFSHFQGTTPSNLQFSNPLFYVSRLHSHAEGGPPLLQGSLIKVMIHTHFVEGQPRLSQRLAHLLLLSQSWEIGSLMLHIYIYIPLNFSRFLSSSKQRHIYHPVLPTPIPTPHYLLGI